MNGSWLQRQAQLHPERPAFIGKIKAGRLLPCKKKSRLMLCYYEHRIPQTIERVAILSNNSPEMYFTILALWELGKQIQFLNTRLTEKELYYQLTDAACQWVVTNRSLSLPRIKFLPFGKLQERFFFCADFDLPKTQVASIMYTSGTTGNPKGVPQTFGNHFASAQATQINLSVTADDCWCCVVPLYHISGLSILLRSLILGISVRLYDRFDAQQIASDLAAGKGTVLSLVTKMLIDLLPLTGDNGYPSLRYILFRWWSDCQISLDAMPRQVLISYSILWDD